MVSILGGQPVNQHSTGPSTSGDSVLLWSLCLGEARDSGGCSVVCSVGYNEARGNNAGKHYGNNANQYENNAKQYENNAKQYRNNAKICGETM